MHLLIINLPGPSAKPRSYMSTAALQIEFTLVDLWGQQVGPTGLDANGGELKLSGLCLKPVASPEPSLGPTSKA